VIEDVVVEVVTDQLESEAEAPDSSRARRNEGASPGKGVSDSTRTGDTRGSGVNDELEGY
jgi:hypothetical protein